jgi:hypothetical protein
MTTLWEMAATIRAEEAAPDAIRVKPEPTSARTRGGLQKSIDLREHDRMEYWCKSLGATHLQLYRAVAHVGPDPSAVRRFLTARFLPGNVRA